MAPFARTPSPAVTKPMMMMMIPKTRLAFALASLLPGAAAAQAPTPSPTPPPSGAESARFPAEVEQVTVDVVVTDKKGVPATGLTTADFQIIEDDKPQTIASFEAVELPGDGIRRPRRNGPGSPPTSPPRCAPAAPSWSCSTTSTSRR